ncbi:hypothetical protein SGA01_19020 [Streptomyces gardneri]|uniref:Uncharacterized protein n=1 Tax=Streptomyces gardneri TaxID=66892 RepID=A0A4Y3RHU2_9ACTN|nr:hypothetical protein SGA01_19020 [Streptomyces gardneri]
MRTWDLTCGERSPTRAMRGTGREVFVFMTAMLVGAPCSRPTMIPALSITNTYVAVDRVAA